VSALLSFHHHPPMTLETFFEKFDLFADAPDAVAKMRELVLELAVQGKLVAQSSEDEPAFKQLERIAAKKAKTGRVSRVKAGASRGAEPQETETHVPNGWEKTSIAELVTVLNGRAYSKDELLAAGTPVLRVGNLFTSKHWYYSDLQLEPDKYCDKGDLIFAWSASFGPFIWPGPKVIYHYHIWKLELHSEADLHKGYLYWFLQNKTQEIKRAGHGVSMLHMTKEKMEKLEVMLPPLAEQKRIVAKVDELMALCDRLEAQQQERETQASQLARASLARFADAPAVSNLKFLFHESFSIPPSDLRKSILTLAVQGKLAPNVETKRVVLGEVIELISGQHLLAHEQNEKGNGIPYLTGPSDFGPKHPVPARWTETPKVVAEPGDILVTVKGSGVGKTNKLVSEKTAISRQLMAVRVNGADPDFVHLVLMNAADHFQESMTGIAIPGIGRKDVLELETELPPLAEQRRIVAKVDQLMALVDALEAQLAASRATAANLLSALVAELTQPS
jgi:type I restriction enzyme S subunit